MINWRAGSKACPIRFRLVRIHVGHDPAGKRQSRPRGVGSAKRPQKSAQLLAQQPAVVIWPRRDLGHVIWDGGKQVDT